MFIKLLDTITKSSWQTHGDVALLGRNLSLRSMWSFLRVSVASWLIELFRAFWGGDWNNFFVLYDVKFCGLSQILGHILKQTQTLFLLFIEKHVGPFPWQPRSLLLCCFTWTREGTHNSSSQNVKLNPLYSCYPKCMDFYSMNDTWREPRRYSAGNLAIKSCQLEYLVGC